jgi:hypothetical protein
MKINKKQLARISGMSGTILAVYLLSIGNTLGGVIVLGISLMLLLWKFKQSGWFF